MLVAAFDAATDAIVESARAQVETLGLRARRAHRPHLTLAAARVDDPGPVSELAAGVAARHAAFPVALDRVATFPGGVVWLGVAPSPELAALQADADASLLDAGLPRAFDTTEPARWVAHCTLARVPRERLATAQRAVTVVPAVGRVIALAVLLVGGEGDIRHVPLAVRAARLDT